MIEGGIGGGLNRAIKTDSLGSTEQRVEAALPVESHQIVASADVFAVDEDPAAPTSCRSVPVLLLGRGCRQERRSP